MGDDIYDYKTDGGFVSNTQNYFDKIINPSDYMASSSIASNMNNPFSSQKDFTTSIDKNDIGIKDTNSLFGFGGGTDGKIMGMDTGKFALGLGNLGLGFMNYLGAKEYNDAQIDGMRQNMALTQEQFDMFKDFNTKQNNRWA